MTDTALDLILKRRDEIAAAINNLSNQIEELRRELPELDTAERVLRRLDTRTDAQREVDDLLDESPTQVKPANIPTMPEMILEVLGNDIFEEGMEPKDLHKIIANKWWPEVRPEMVGPIAWRMAKRGQLVKDGPRYRLSNKEIAPAQPKSAETTEQGHGSAPVKPGEEVGHETIG